MQLQKKNVGDVALLTITGTISFNDESTLRSALHRIAKDGKHKVVVDCAKMDSLNSHALSTFLKAHKSFKEGKIAFANLNPHVRKVFETSNLDTVFKLYDNVDDALEQMKAETV